MGYSRSLRAPASDLSPPVELAGALVAVGVGASNPDLPGLKPGPGRRDDGDLEEGAIASIEVSFQWHRMFGCSPRRLPSESRPQHVLSFALDLASSGARLDRHAR